MKAIVIFIYTRWILDIDMRLYDKMMMNKLLVYWWILLNNKMIIYFNHSLLECHPVIRKLKIVWG